MRTSFLRRMTDDADEKSIVTRLRWTDVGKHFTIEASQKKITGAFNYYDPSSEALLSKS